MLKLNDSGNDDDNDTNDRVATAALILQVTLIEH